jgi:hypothetical protein
MTFPLMPWEEPSWQARSAAFVLENLRHVGVWIVHGGLDRAVGGGVDVEHARRSARALDELGIPHRYTELPERGHDSGFMREPLFAEVLNWLVSQRRPTAPPTVTYRTQELRHSGAYWVEIKQQELYGAQSRVEVEVGGTLTIKTENVRHLSLTPPATLVAGDQLVIDGTTVTGLDLAGGVGLRREAGGAWTVADHDPPAGQKRPQLAGAFSDLFHAETVLVPGTSGTAEETFFEDWCARDASFFFKQWNGGVHRGGIPGESWVDLKVMTDAEWLAQPDHREGAARNVVAYGTAASNKVIAAVAERFDLGVERGMIRVGENTFKREGLGLIAAIASPEAPGYLGIHAGTSPDATTAGAHLNWQLLPDYLVYDQERVLEWGFFDNDWRPVPAETAESEGEA